VKREALVAVERRPPVPIEVGLNRFVWDTRYPDAVRFPGMILWAGETRGPKLPPGTIR
jgi:hypothetical protein